MTDVNDGTAVVYMRIEASLSVSIKVSDDFYTAKLCLEAIPDGSAEACIKHIEAKLTKHVMEQLQAQKKAVQEQFRAPTTASAAAPAAASPAASPKGKERTCEKCGKALDPNQPANHTVCLECYKKQHRSR